MLDKLASPLRLADCACLRHYNLDMRSLSISFFMAAQCSSMSLVHMSLEKVYKCPFRKVVNPKLVGK